MPKIQFALALVGPSDELLIRVFDSEETLRQFAALNPPSAEFITGPLANAASVRSVWPSEAIGYLATKLEDGIPVAATTFYWVENDEDFDPSVPLFYQPESVV